MSSLGGQQLDRIDGQHIEEFVQSRSKEVGVSTVNHSLRTLRRVLRLAEEWKVIRRAPKIRLLSGEHQREFVITNALLMKMLNHEKCAPSLKDLLPFLVDTGLRISEAIGLKWEHIDFNKRTVFVSDGKTKNARRDIPMTERVYQVLIRLKESEEVYVFASRSRHSVSEQFRTLRDEMKLPSDCCIHSCRHTFLTRLGASGCDVFTLMRLAGHASVTISQGYVHPDAKNMEDAVARLEPKVAVTPYP